MKQEEAKTVEKPKTVSGCGEECFLKYMEYQPKNLLTYYYGNMHKFCTHCPLIEKEREKFNEKLYHREYVNEDIPNPDPTTED